MSSKMLGRKHNLSSTSTPAATAALSLSSEDGGKIYKSKRTIHLSGATSRSAPPAPPSISFSDADDNNGYPLHSSSLKHKTSSGAVIHPYADLDLIAETNSAAGPTHSGSSAQGNNNIHNIDADGDEFDPAILTVLSSGESDVHSILSAPGDIPSHRDRLANLGLTPVPINPRRDKAAQILGIPHRQSMEPLPAHHHLSTSSNNTTTTNGNTNKSHRFSSFGSRSATGGYTNPHPTIHESDIGGGTTHSIRSLGIPTRSRAMSAATTNTGMSIGFGLDSSGDDVKTPLSSLYLVAGLPKSHHAWTLADPDSVLGLQHSEGAVNKWWRPEVLGSTVSPGVAPAAKEETAKTPIAAANALASSAASIDKKKRRRANTGATIPGAVNPRDPGAGIGLSKSQVAKMLSKALKLSFTREVEIVASTLQPPSTVHTFTFTLPTPADRELGLPSTLPSANNGGRDRDVHSSVYSTGGRGLHTASGMGMIASARPSSTYLGPVTTPLTPAAQEALQAESANATTYYGVCLTVWSHADEERSRAIRRTVEVGMHRDQGSVRRGGGRRKKDSIPPVPSLPGAPSNGQLSTNAGVARALRTSNPDQPGGLSTPYGTDVETEADDFENELEGEGETDIGGLSESDWEGGRGNGGGGGGGGSIRNGITGNGGRGEMGGSTLFLPGDTIFWLPYALTLVSRVPIYDLMRDFLTFSWARFSKDVHSHTLQIAKILSAPIPKPGELIKLDASPSNADKDKGVDKSGRALSSSSATLEMICRMPGGLDFGKGLVDVNFQMWPLFCALSLDNILTCCEIALSPTGRVLFISRHPSMLGIAVSTIKYLVELRGWSGIALPAVHSRDAKIFLEDPGPWIIGLATEARYLARTAPEVCICDIDINYVNCLAPPPGHISTKGRRDRYRRILLSAFDAYFHPDHSIPSEFKEAFPAGRFRPVTKIQSRRGASSSVGTEAINPPEWWNWTRVVGAFNEVLQDRDKPLSLLKRITNIRGPKKQAKLSPAELLIQMNLRKRASAFVDARDDLETKIGRLSRRLNFLLTESDLWRDKFVQFEAYAEKLSAEAIDLRNKIGKEQRESRRLTSIVTMTAQEKAKLQAQLMETEAAQRSAANELEKMKGNMDRMEAERSQMVAEVEAQIERALQSMMVGDSDLEWDEDDLDSIPNEATSPTRVRSPILDSVSNPGINSRPLSPGSVISASSRNPPLRRRMSGRSVRSAWSEGGKSVKMKSFGTAATLADIADKLETVKALHASRSKPPSEHGRRSKSRASSHHATTSERGGGSSSSKQKLMPLPVRHDAAKLSGEEAEDENSSLSEKERQERDKSLKQATKRFSTGAAEGGKDGTSGGDGMLSSVDAGIVEQSDRIAEKMKQIQQRFEVAMAAEAEQDTAMEPVVDAHGSGSEDEEKFTPAPLTTMAPRPRPTRAARPAPPQLKAREAEATIPSGPTTPTASNPPRSHRTPRSSAHADTEAWRESVATAAQDADWRESTVTAAVPEQTTSSLYDGVKAIGEHEVAKFVPRLRKVASGASIGALGNGSPTPPISANTTSAHSESMSSGAHTTYMTNNSRFRPESRGGITTDGDSDADFQSAYSNSPRMTAGELSELEKSGSGDNAAGYSRNSKRRSRQITSTLMEPQHPYALARPSYSGTALSTGAVGGGLGLTSGETDSRSRASSVVTSVGLEKRAASQSGSDHTVGGGPLDPLTADFGRGSHPPVVSRGIPGNRARKDSGTSLTKPNGINVA